MSYPATHPFNHHRWWHNARVVRADLLAEHAVLMRVARARAASGATAYWLGRAADVRRELASVLRAMAFRNSGKRGWRSAWLLAPPAATPAESTTSAAGGAARRMP